MCTRFGDGTRAIYGRVLFVVESFRSLTNAFQMLNTKLPRLGRCARNVFGTVTFHTGIPGFCLVFPLCFHPPVLDGCFTWKYKIKHRHRFREIWDFLFLSPHKKHTLFMTFYRLKRFHKSGLDGLYSFGNQPKYITGIVNQFVSFDRHTDVVLRYSFQVNCLFRIRHDTTTFHRDTVKTCLIKKNNF